MHLFPFGKANGRSSFSKISIKRMEWRKQRRDMQVFFESVQLNLIAEYKLTKAN